MTYIRATMVENKNIELQSAVLFCARISDDRELGQILTILKRV